MRLRLLFALGALVLGLVATPLAASPDVPHVSDWAVSDDMIAIGFSPNPVPLEAAAPDDGVFNSDLAFWGPTVVQGTYDGFRLINASHPSNPKVILNYEDCYPEGNRQGGNQGDIAIWETILSRSSNSPAGSGVTCDGDPVPQGFEGLIIFDISDRKDPDVVAMVDLPCGSHTQTLVPDVENGRVLIYSSASSNAAECRGIDIVEIPLADPSAATYLGLEPSGDPVPDLPNLVTIAAPSSAAGTYEAAGAAFGATPPETGLSGNVVLVDDGAGASNTDACEPLVGFPAGAIALVDRGSCTFLLKAQNAQAAGAVAVIVANNVAGSPFEMGGDDPGHTVTIPAVMISQADGATIKAGLPASATIVSRLPETPERACHDTGVILGDALLAACAGHDGLSVWSLDPADGGSLEDPAILYSRMFEGVTIGHSAAFTFDGEVIVFGHEPGGGSQARCQATSAEVDRTLFFVDADTGDTIGTFLHPRPQTATENCTWHNYNVVPLKSRSGKTRYVLVSGNYQSGISVIDFSDPASAEEIAFADPPPLVNPDNPDGIELGGDWSTYWYNGRIYESDITRGLTIWRLENRAVQNAKYTPHLNPQTAEFTIGN